MSNKFIPTDYNHEPKGKFLGRYVSAMKLKEAASVTNEQEEFNSGYRKGTLRFATASKFLGLRNCGLDRFAEDNSTNIWVKEGDQIVRVVNDTSWIKELLDQEGK